MAVKAIAQVLLPRPVAIYGCLPFRGFNRSAEMPELSEYAHGQRLGDEMRFDMADGG